MAKHRATRATPGSALAQKAVRGTLWLFVQGVTVNVSSLVVFVVLGRLLVPEQFGLVAAASVVVLFMRTLVDAGVSGALIQKADLDSDVIDTAFWLSVLIGLALTGIALLTAPWIAAGFGQPGLAPIVRALSPVIMLAALDRTQSALLDRQLDFRAQAIRSTVAALVSTAVAIVAAARGAGAYSLVAQTLIFEAVSAMLLWRLATWRPRLRFERRHLGRLFAFGWRNSVIQILGYLGANIDNLLIAAFLGPVALGIYAVGYRVLIVFDELVSMTLRRVALPAFSRLQADPAAMNDALVRAAGMSAAVILPAAAGLACTAPNLVAVVFGAKWDRSAVVMGALAGVAVVLAATTPIRNFVIAMGQISNELHWAITFLVLESLGFLVAAQFNVVVVAATLTGIGLVYWPLRVWTLRQLSGLEPRRYWRVWTRPFVATVAMVAATVGVGFAVGQSQHRGLALILQIVVGVLVYVAVTWQIDRPNLRRIIDMVRLAGGAA